MHASNLTSPESSPARRLVCPTCRAPLEASAGEYRCGACQARFAVRDGVVDLLPAAAAEIETDYTESGRRPAWSFREASVEQMFLRIRALVAAEADRLGRPLDLLDIGSGGLLRGTGGEGGRFFRILRDHARSYVGIEPSWEMLRQVAVPDGNVGYLPDALLVRSAGEILPVRPGSIDVVLCLAVLDHCIDAAEVVRRAREALRPGGLFILTLQNDAAWYREVVRVLAPGYYRRRVEADNHHQRFDPAAARGLFEAHGFRDVATEDLGYLLAPGVERLATVAFYGARALGPSGAARVARAIDGACARVLPEHGVGFLLHARADRSPAG